MSVEHLSAVLHHSKAKGTNKLVLLGIANHAGDGGAWPSIATLAKYANVTDRNVRKAIDKLVSLGEVRVHVQAGGTHQTADHMRPNRYDVLVSCPPYCDRTPQHRDTRKLSGPQTSLWKTGGSHPTGGVASDRGGLSHPTGDPLSQTSPEPSIEPHANEVVPQPQTAREAPPRLDWRPCQVCSMPQRTCEARQTKLLPEDQHHYEPNGWTGYPG